MPLLVTDGVPDFVGLTEEVAVLLGVGDTEGVPDLLGVADGVPV